MDRQLTDVLKILGEEIGVYRELVELARRKTALLVQGRLEAIQESNKTEETCSLKLRILENEMSRLCGELCQLFKIPREEFTLLRLAADAGPPLAAEIRTQTSLFKNLIEQLKSVNRRNTRLIESSIRYSRGLLDFLNSSSGSYQQNGLFRPMRSLQTTWSRRA